MEKYGSEFTHISRKRTKKHICEAFIKGAKAWYKGGLIKFYFEVQKIKKRA